MLKRYPVLLILAMTSLLAAGCGAQEGATPPFDRYQAQQVVDALNAAGATVQNPVQNMTVGRNAPSTFNNRIIFEVPRIAPDGGQILTFRSAGDLQAWQDYITGLRNDPNTRRSVIYVYVKDNVLLQLNANLTNAEATQYGDALQAMN
ncbi:MAG: hypothetical protein IT320_26215 [Anaerolineae bacterium]|nr:hypothetical protein [Anaerolineae bacterium]